MHDSNQIHIFQRSKASHAWNLRHGPVPHWRCRALSDRNHLWTVGALVRKDQPWISEGFPTGFYNRHLVKWQGASAAFKRVYLSLLGNAKNPVDPKPHWSRAGFDIRTYSTFVTVEEVLQHGETRSTSKRSKRSMWLVSCLAESLAEYWSCRTVRLPISLGTQCGAHRTYHVASWTSSGYYAPGCSSDQRKLRINLPSYGWSVVQQQYITYQYITSQYITSQYITSQYIT